MATRSFRAQYKLTQSELARLLGVRQATVSDWEQGKSQPSRLALFRLAELAREMRAANPESAQRELW